MNCMLAGAHFLRTGLRLILTFFRSFSRAVDRAISARDPSETPTLDPTEGVARLQATLANAARGADHYKNLDEREIASGLKDWVVEIENSSNMRRRGSGKNTLPATSHSACF